MQGCGRVVVLSRCATLEMGFDTIERVITLILMNNMAAEWWLS